MGARRALVPCPARKWRAGGPAHSQGQHDWAGTGREVPWPIVPPPHPSRGALGGLRLLPCRAEPGLAVAGVGAQGLAWDLGWGETREA